MGINLRYGSLFQRPSTNAIAKHIPFWLIAKNLARRIALPSLVVTSLTLSSCSGIIPIAQKTGTKTQTKSVSPAKGSIKPSQEDAIAIMESICGEGGVTIQGDKALCNSCPSGVGNGVIGGELELKSVVYGSFTEANVKEAFVDLEGCQPHALLYGGSALLRDTGNGWSLVRYEEGLRSDNCYELQQNDGRHILACRVETFFQGVSSDNIFSVEINPNKSERKVLFYGGNNEIYIAGCQPPYYDIKVLDFVSRDINNDGQNDLTLKISEAISNVDNCKPDLSSPNTHELNFVLDDNSLTPTPETATLLEKFKEQLGRS